MLVHDDIGFYEDAVMMDAVDVFLHGTTSEISKRIFKARVQSISSCATAVLYDTDGLRLYLLERIDASLTNQVMVTIALASALDWPIVQKVWDSLTNARLKGAFHLCLRIRLLQTDGIGRRTADQLIVDVDDHTQIQLQNKIEAVCKNNSREQSIVLSKSSPLVWSSLIEAVYLSNCPEEDLFSLVRDLNIGAKTRIVFLRGSRLGLHERIPRDFWKQIFTTALPSVLGCDDALRIEPLRLFTVTEPTALFVFPERMLPLARAYFVRALDLLLGLNYGGMPTAVFLLGPDNSDLDSVRRALEVISPNVYVFPLRRGKYPWWHRVIRQTERLLIKRLGGDPSGLTMRFSERCWTFATSRNAKLLEAVVDKLASLRHVIYTGAWFTPAIMCTKRRHSNIQWHCDTHDVFYVLDRDANRHHRRYLYSATFYKRMEVKLLQHADTVIAISEADRRSLLEGGCYSPVLVESGSFTHAARGINPAAGNADGLVFGFIGSKNRNNEKCLRIVREDWWPRIVSKRPGASLRIAGSVGDSAEAKLLQQAYPDRVSIVGFVDRLPEFYASVTAMLSPIAVQGGLNFKSVEALMAGRPLLTNELGSRCLADGLDGILIVDDSASRLEAQLRLFDDAAALELWRMKIHAAADHHYGDAAAYQGLIVRLLS